MYSTRISSSHGHRSVLQAVFVARMRRDTHYLTKIKAQREEISILPKFSLGSMQEPLNRDSLRARAYENLRRPATNQTLKYWLCCVCVLLCFRTSVTVHLLQSRCTRGLQYPKQSGRRLKEPRLLSGFNTKHR